MQPVLLPPKKPFRFWRLAKYFLVFVLLFGFTDLIIGLSFGWLLAQAIAIVGLVVIASLVLGAAIIYTLKELPRKERVIAGFFFSLGATGVLLVAVLGIEPPTDPLVSFFRFIAAYFRP